MMLGRIVHKVNWACCITKTYLYNFDPLKPHFYTVKLGFAGVYIIFLISTQKHSLWYSLELPRWGGSNEYPQSMFWAEIWKISEFLYLKTFSFGWWNFSIYLNRRVFVMAYNNHKSECCGFSLRYISLQMSYWYFAEWTWWLEGGLYF